MTTGGLKIIPQAACIDPLSEEDHHQREAAAMLGAREDLKYMHIVLGEAPEKNTMKVFLTMPVLLPLAYPTI